MDKFLDIHNLPLLKQEEIENLNRQIISIEIESAIKKLLTNKSPGLQTSRKRQRFSDRYVRFRKKWWAKRLVM